MRDDISDRAAVILGIAYCAVLAGLALLGFGFGALW
jgi:hypothetical protein